MLDLPHYHCNNVYVPWLSKGNRRTKTMQNNIGMCTSFPIPLFQLRRQFKVRGHAFDFISRPGSGSRASSIASVIGSQYRLSDTRPGSPLRVNTDVSGTLSTNQRELYGEADARCSVSVLSPTRQVVTPISRVRCDGWCGYDLIPRATVVGVDSPRRGG